MKIYAGPAYIADRTGATILPVRLDGAGADAVHAAQGGQVTPRTGSPRSPSPSARRASSRSTRALRGKARRQIANLQLYDDHVRHGVQHHRLGPDPVRGAAARPRPARLALPDAGGHQRRPPRLHEAGGGRPGPRPQARRADRAGRSASACWCPTSMPPWSPSSRCRPIGRVPAMLNFSAGPANLEAAVRHRPDQLVVSSRRVRRARPSSSPSIAAHRRPRRSSSGSRTCASRSAPSPGCAACCDSLFARPHPSPAAASSRTTRRWSCSPRARRAGPRASCSATATSWPTAPRSRPGSTSTRPTRCSTRCRCSTASA